MRPNKDRRTEIILYGLLLIPLLFAAAALAQATEQAQGLAEITAVLSEILHTPSMLRWCASTPKFLLAVLMLYPLAVYCYIHYNIDDGVLQRLMIKQMRHQAAIADSVKVGKRFRPDKRQI